MQCGVPVPCAASHQYIHQRLHTRKRLFFFPPAGKILHSDYKRSWTPTPILVFVSRFQAASEFLGWNHTACQKYTEAYCMYLKQNSIDFNTHNKQVVDMVTWSYIHRSFLGRETRYEHASITFFFVCLFFGVHSKHDILH